MRTILSYLLTPVYLFLFGFYLLVFHPVQVFARLVFGNPARKKTVDVLNYLLLYSLRILGARITFSGFEKIPEGRPLIIVANHQSTFDIPPVVWGFRKFNPCFISKMELGKNIPSISYNLRYGGSALIDRKNPRQSIREISKVGQMIEKDTRSVCIFPEGTRSKTGKVRSFQSAGILGLLKTAPSALVVPFVIDGNRQLMAKGYFPLQFGLHLTYTVLDPIEPNGKDGKEITEMAELAIKKYLGQA
jgi:1-acyl-sn-glycerol-3-phosphate acyltransferase